MLYTDVNPSREDYFTPLSESSIILSEKSLLQTFKDNRAKKELIKQTVEEFKEMKPDDVGALIITRVKKFANSTKGKELGYEFLKDGGAKAQLDMVYNNYTANPGKLAEQKTEHKTFGGIPCILVSQKKKNDDKFKFFQLVYVVKTNNISSTLEIITPQSGATIVVDNK